MDVRVTRAFMWAGARQEIGSVIDVADGAARELVHMRKAEFVSAVPAAAVMTTLNTTALVPAKAGKGSKHAVE